MSVVVVLWMLNWSGGVRGEEAASGGASSVEELFAASWEQERVKHTMKALMALEEVVDEERVELEELLKRLFPSKNNYLARVDDYVRPQLPYVFDAITPQQLEVDWSPSEVASIFARFDADEDGTIENSEVPSALSRFVEYLIETPKSDTRRMWSVLKNVSCECRETDDAENFARVEYAPCLFDSTLRVLDEAVEPSCRVGADYDSLTADEFDRAAARVFRQRFNTTSSHNVSFHAFRRFILDEPAEITAAISQLIYVGALAPARALLLQQIMLAASDLFTSPRTDIDFEINDGYRQMLNDRSRRHLFLFVWRFFGGLLAVGLAAYVAVAISNLKAEARKQKLKIAYLAGVANLDYLSQGDDAAFEAGRTDAAMRESAHFPAVARATLKSLRLDRFPPCCPEEEEEEEEEQQQQQQPTTTLLGQSQNPSLPSSSLRRRRGDLLHHRPVPPPPAAAVPS